VDYFYFNGGTPPPYPISRISFCSEKLSGIEGYHTPPLTGNNQKNVAIKFFQKELKIEYFIQNFGKITKTISPNEIENSGPISFKILVKTPKLFHPMKLRIQFPFHSKFW